MKKPWSPEEIAMLEREYANSHTPTLAKQMGRGVGGVYQKALSLGLSKSDAYLASPLAGRTDGKRGGKSRFKSGHETWNKGMKGYSAPGTEATRFGAGQMPHNHVPIGSRQITKDGYIRVKTAEPKTWELLHRVIWREAGNEIPVGYALKFRDLNKQNCSIENLYLMKRADLMAENTIHRYPPELKEVIRLQAKLSRRLNEQH